LAHGDSSGDVERSTSKRLSMATRTFTARVRQSLGILFVAFASTRALGAQVVPPGEAGAIIGAALSSARPLAPRGEAAAEIPTTLGVSAAQVTAALATARLKAARLADVRVCTGGGPSGCHLVGPGVFLQVSRIAGSATTAEVDVTIFDETPNTRQPIHGQEVTVTVVREGSGWRVTKVTPLWTS
jgi:hypothetical protein